MFNSIFIPFISITLAEFLDKSQLMVLLLASRTKKHLQLFLGVILAFAIVDGSAILAGAWLTNIIPTLYVKIAAGTIFILFGFLSLRSQEEEEQTKVAMKNPFFTGLWFIFLSEWGDKTQIASALFATKYNPFYVFIGVMLALSLLSFLAILFGKVIAKKVKKQVINKISGIVMIIIGLLFFFT